MRVIKTVFEPVGSVRGTVIGTPCGTHCTWLCGGQWSGLSGSGFACAFPSLFLHIWHPDVSI